MDFELLRSIVDQSAGTTLEYHLDMIGEPLLNKEVLKFIEYAAQRDAAVVLYTNLAERDDALIRALGRAHVSRVIVNLSAADREEYARKYGRDALSVVLKNLKLLVEARGNSSHPRVIVSWLQLDGPPPKGLLADEVWVKRPHNWLGTKGLGIEKVPRPWSPKRCTRLWASASVLWDGRVVTCCYDHAARRVLGDLRKQSLFEVWNSEEMWELRRNHRAYDPCKDCVDPDPQLSLRNIKVLMRSWLHKVYSK